MLHPASLLALLLAAVPALAQAQPRCTLPASIERPEVRRADYRNAGVRTDYLAWVLSWSPEHCARNGGARRHHFQCSLNRFDFVVHGLWPQHARARSSRDHPRHCKGSGPLDASLVRRHLCTVPGPDLMQHQWQAHGTCHWQTPHAYFDVIDRLARTYRLPDHERLAGARGAAGIATVRAGDVKAAFIALNPGLSREQLRVSVASGNWLKEVWVCLSADRVDPVPVACPRGGTPDGQVVRIRSP
jgi:ribonuclease T2